MDDQNPEIDEKTYMQGASLTEALSEFGNPELWAAYNIEFNPAAHRHDIQKSGNFMEGLSAAIGGLQAISQLKNHRDNIIQELKSDILNLIRRGDLIAYGFKEPRNLSDIPVKIPADLFLSGELNWDHSELKYKALEFSGIRLFRDISPVIDLKAENRNKEIPPLKNKSKNIADLDHDLHIDEKRAAEYLGISFRTLQGYRVKGGGPEFIKIGKKSVRYKVQDLIDWANNHKKKNTSQY